MSQLPEKLSQLIDQLAVFDDPVERSQILIDYADRFREVPADIAQRPYPESNRIPACESDAYVWVTQRSDDTLKLHFAVENPSGVSAKALAVILDMTLSGLRATEIARVDTGIVEKIFRRNISMGKGMGLMSMVSAVQQTALRLTQQQKHKP